VAQSPVLETIMKTIIFAVIVLLCSNLLCQQAYLGIRFSPPTASELRSTKLNYGIKIVEIVPGSPAETNGLILNDIIYQINNDIIRNEADLQRIIAKKQPGDVINIHISNGKQQFTKRVTLSSRNALYHDLYIYNYIQNPWLWMGIQVETISTSLANLLNLEKGMVVTSVREKSIAESQGLEPGDIVISVNSMNTSDENTLTDALTKGLQNQPMLFRIWRNSRTITKEVDLSNNIDHNINDQGQVFIKGPDIYDDELYMYSKDRINSILNKSKSERELDIDRLENEIFQLRQLLENQ